MSTPNKKLEYAEQYVSNENQALRDWYREFQSQETGLPGSDISFPDGTKIAETFEAWFSESRDFLVELICIQWDYPAKRRSNEYKAAAAYAVALADFFLAQRTKLPSPLALASILVVKGLDRLCNIE